SRRQRPRNRTALFVDALDQREGPLRAAEQREDRTTLLRRQLGAELHAALAQLLKDRLTLIGLGRYQSTLPVGNDGAHRVGDLVKHRVDDLLAWRRERLALDTAGDLVERLDETRRPVLLLDHAGQQFGLVGRRGLHHRRSVVAHFAVEDIELL